MVKENQVMEEKVLDVLGTVNESLLTYEGENMQ